MMLAKNQAGAAVLAAATIWATQLARVSRIPSTVQIIQGIIRQGVSALIII
jgi:hypothetical protein